MAKKTKKDGVASPADIRRALKLAKKGGKGMSNAVTELYRGLRLRHEPTVSAAVESIEHIAKRGK